MCVGYKADALFLEIETGNARTVKPLTLPLLSFVYLLVSVFFSLSCHVFISHSCVCSVMRRANEEVHGSLVKQRNETKRVKDKVRYLFIF
jgi:hypothetical protein